ncbi:hypothetical protein VPH35_127021 [Triticum aestivum]
MQLAQGPPTHEDGSIHNHPTVLHSYPAPNPIIHTLLPFFIKHLASMYDNSYHTDEVDWFPNRCSVIFDGSTCLSDRLRPRCTEVITAGPPTWMQKCSNATLKLGMYGLMFLKRSTFLATLKNKNLRSSDVDRTRGPVFMILALSALRATSIRSLERATPMLPFSSSS